LSHQHLESEWLGTQELNKDIQGTDNHLLHPVYKAVGIQIQGIFHNYPGYTSVKSTAGNQNIHLLPNTEAWMSPYSLRLISTLALFSRVHPIHFH